MASDWRARFDADVEAVRVGTVIAHDRKAASRWRASRMSSGGAMSGQALEGAVMGLARRNPEYVVMGA